MEIIFEKYDWKFIGIPKDTSSEKELTVFQHLAPAIIRNLMDQMAWYNVEDSIEFRTSERYLEIKSDLHRKLKLTQEKQLIKMKPLSNLTGIPEEKLLNFMEDMESEDFHSGELYMLSSKLYEVLAE